MRTIFLLILVSCLFRFIAFSQISNSFSVDISKDRIYDKNTHQRLAENEIIQLCKTNPRLIFEPVIDKYGEYESFFVDPLKTDNRVNRDTSQRVRKNEIFPPFVMRTIENKIIDSESLKGRIILLQFNLVFRPPFFQKKTIDEFNELVKEFQKISDIASIIISESPKDEVLEQFGSDKYISEIVPNGHGFNLRYLNIDFPTYILVDKHGRLVSYYCSKDLEKLKSDFSKIK